MDSSVGGVGDGVFLHVRKKTGRPPDCFPLSTRISPTPNLNAGVQLGNITTGDILIGIFV